MRVCEHEWGGEAEEEVDRLSPSLSKDPNLGLDPRTPGS